MKLEWTTIVSCDNMWEPEMAGVFIHKDNETLFYFKKRDRLCCCSATTQKVATVQTVATVPRLLLPTQWLYQDCCEKPILMIDSERALNLEDNCMLETSQCLREQYADCFGRKYVSESFLLQEYTIFQRGNCGYVCYKNGEELWRFTGKAYLYTDIIRWNNRIFWGTAGHRGFFYVLDIDSGTPIAAIKTAGTRFFVQIDSFVYLLRNVNQDSQAELLCVNLMDGNIMKAIQINGIATVNSRIQLLDNKLHIVTFEYSKGIFRDAVWSCLSF